MTYVFSFVSLKRFPENFSGVRTRKPPSPLSYALDLIVIVQFVLIDLFCYLKYANLWYTEICTSINNTSSERSKSRASSLRGSEQVSKEVNKYDKQCALCCILKLFVRVEVRASAKVCDRAKFIPIKL
jgi:hypothetical protein